MFGGFACPPGRPALPVGSGPHACGWATGLPGRWGTFGALRLFQGFGRKPLSFLKTCVSPNGRPRSNRHLYTGMSRFGIRACFLPFHHGSRHFIRSHSFVALLGVQRQRLPTAPALPRGWPRPELQYEQSLHQNPELNPETRKAEPRIY